MIFHAKDFTYSKHSKTYVSTTSSIEHMFKNCNGLDETIIIQSSNSEHRFVFAHAEECKETGFVKWWKYANVEWPGTNGPHQVIIYNHKYLAA